MRFTAKPHVSDAVCQLRGWVTIAATVLALCCATQMVVYAFAAYTDARWDEVRTLKNDKPLRVVGAPDQAAPATAPETDAVHAQVVGGIRTGAPVAKATEITRVRSNSDVWMLRASGMAMSVGVLASLGLCVLTMLGLVVAGGGCVPGVERVTRACVWSMVMTMLCLPWGRIMPSLGLPGIFASYADLTGALDSRTLGGTTVPSITLTAQWFAAPLVTMFTALGVCLWFRSGVERGVIVTSPSELDRAVEREAEMINKRGVSASSPKAVGALNQAIGSAPNASGTLSAVERAAEEAAALASLVDPGVTATGKRTSRSVVDSDFKRPI